MKMCDTTVGEEDTLSPELEVIKDIPCYRVILKAVLRHQIQQLLQQLSEYTEEESVILSASLSDGQFSHLGTASGKVFLEQHEELKTSFLNFCLKRHNGQPRPDASVSPCGISPVPSTRSQETNEDRLSRSGSPSASQHSYAVPQPCSSSFSRSQPQASAGSTQPHCVSPATLSTNNSSLQPQSYLNTFTTDTSGTFSILNPSPQPQSNLNTSTIDTSGTLSSINSSLQPQSYPNTFTTSSMSNQPLNLQLVSNPTITPSSSTVYSMASDTQSTKMVLVHIVPTQSLSSVRGKPYILPKFQTGTGNARKLVSLLNYQKKPMVHMTRSLEGAGFSSQDNETNLRIVSVQGGVKVEPDDTVLPSPISEPEVKIEVPDSEDTNTGSTWLSNTSSAVSSDFPSVVTSVLGLKSLCPQSQQVSDRQDSLFLSDCQVLLTRMDPNDKRVKHDKTQSDTCNRQTEKSRSPEIVSGNEASSSFQTVTSQQEIHTRPASPVIADQKNDQTLQTSSIITGQQKPQTLPSSPVITSQYKNLTMQRLPLTTGQQKYQNLQTSLASTDHQKTQMLHHSPVIIGQQKNQTLQTSHVDTGQQKNPNLQTSHIITRQEKYLTLQLLPVLTGQEQNLTLQLLPLKTDRPKSQNLQTSNLITEQLETQTKHVSQGISGQLGTHTEHVVTSQPEDQTSQASDHAIIRKLKTQPEALETSPDPHLPACLPSDNAAGDVANSSSESANDNLAGPATSGVQPHVQLCQQSQEFNLSESHKSQDLSDDDTLNNPDFRNKSGDNDISDNDLVSANGLSDSSDLSVIVPQANACLPSFSRKKKLTEHTSATDAKRRKTAKKQERENNLSVPSTLDQTKNRVTVQKSNNEKGKRKWDKVQYCLFCSKSSTNISKHYLGVHKTEDQVKKILEMTKNSKERSLELMRLRNAGNNKHNIDVLKVGQGELVTSARKPNEMSPNEFLPCDGCLGFFLRENLWRHRKVCPLNTGGQKSRKVQAKAGLLLPSPIEISKGLKENVVSKMSWDRVTITARNDKVIMKIGENLYQKHGKMPHLYSYISLKMRELGRLLIAVRKQDTNIQCMIDILTPEKFPTVVQATKVLCKFDDKTNTYTNPHLALKLGPLLKKCANVLKADALTNGNVEERNKADGFLSLCSDKWTDEISSSALRCLTNNKMNKGQTVSTEAVINDDNKSDDADGDNLNAVIKGPRTEPADCPCSPPAAKSRHVHRLTDEQSSLLRTLFKTNISFRRELRQQACQRVIDKHPILEDLSWKKVKNTVHNWIMLEKRKVKTMSI